MLCKAQFGLSRPGSMLGAFLVCLAIGACSSATRPQQPPPELQGRLAELRTELTALEADSDSFGPALADAREAVAAARAARDDDPNRLRRLIVQAEQAVAAARAESREAQSPASANETVSVEERMQRQAAAQVEQQLARAQEDVQETAVPAETAPGEGESAESEGSGGATAEAGDATPTEAADDSDTQQDSEPPAEESASEPAERRRGQTAYDTTAEGVPPEESGPEGSAEERADAAGDEASGDEAPGERVAEDASTGDAEEAGAGTPTPQPASSTEGGQQDDDTASGDDEEAATALVLGDSADEADAPSGTESGAADSAKAAQSAEPTDIRAGTREVTEDDIARLGNELTPVGAERAGNEDGTIPAWTGGITEPPPGYSRGMHHPDPYADDERRFVITPANYSQYRNRLTVGQEAMFERYDSYAMPVYATRRSASFPQRIYEATKENARTARLTPNGEGVLDATEGFPFPLPQNAYHLIWNHKLKFKGISLRRYNNQVAPTAGGAYTVIGLLEETLGPYYRPGATIEDINNILLYFYQEVTKPARLAGNILLVHETLNQVEQERQAWIYNPGQRRVRRAPNVAYDNPGTASDGLRTNDMTDMFNGALDRYNWQLKGKTQIYVPYNSYRAHSGDLTPDDLVRAGHLNPDVMRYELHRVWVVEARLKEGTRHIHPRRTFYLDEDSYQILLTEHYDANGDLWRFSEAHSINYYQVPTFWSTIEVHHDLQSGRYIAVGLDNQEPAYDFQFESSPSNYTPAALRMRGRR